MLSTHVEILSENEIRDIFIVYQLEIVDFRKIIKEKMTLSLISLLYSQLELRVWSSHLTSKLKS
jgi:hypothetical protein